MTIYFIHFFGVFFPFSILSAIFFGQNKYNFTKLVFAAFVFSYFAFFISYKNLAYENLYFISLGVLSLVLIASGVLFFVKNENFIIKMMKNILLFLLAFCFGVKYFVVSIDFPIFSTSLLDTLAISSFSFIFLAFVLCIGFYLFFTWIKEFNFLFLKFFVFFIVFLYINDSFAHMFLYLMRNGMMDTWSFSLSYVAKSIYYANFYVYFLLIFTIFCVFLALKKRNFKINKSKDFDILFRKNEARNSKITFFSASIFLFSVLSFSILLFYDLHASKPIKIDEPTYVEPDENNEFVFDVAMLRDNKLHRFAYISDEGKVVRFFLINKREDRDSPVAVFDACSICGDMGYVKKDAELICISCNVRIFLPSVGKAGGCNPIPMQYKFENSKVIIAFSEILSGVNYFTQVVEKKVYDPIDGSELINLKAPKSYMYKGRTYFFANDKNYETFKNDPEKFVDENQSSKFRIHNLLGK